MSTFEVLGFSYDPDLPPLRICTIKRSDLPSCATAILHLFFFARSKPSFASLTETPEEISLVCHVDDLFRFPPDVVKSSEQSWKALHITLGALGYSTELLCSRFIIPPFAFRSAFSRT